MVRPTAMTGTPAVESDAATRLPTQPVAPVTITPIGFGAMASVICQRAPVVFHRIL